MKLINTYKIYVHVFPNGKKYVGYTKTPVKQRWSGGLGYQSQWPVFSAILKFGWNNIRHYIIMDGLSEEEAKLYEAAFIYHWETYKKGKGYNTVLPNVEEAKEINVPNLASCKKTKIEDKYEIEVRERYDNMKPSPRTRKVRCIETGEIFPDALRASMRYSTGRASAVYGAIRLGRPSGTCWIPSDLFEGYVEVPAHWEYVS